MQHKTNPDNLQKLVNEAIDILFQLGIPLTNLTTRRQERMAKCLIALAGITTELSWKDALSIKNNHKLLSREIINYLNNQLGESLSLGSYDDIRRKDLLLPVEAGIVTKSALNPNANTNDGTRPYALSEEVAAQLRLYGTKNWQVTLVAFNKGQILLTEKLAKARALSKVSVVIDQNVVLKFSPGAHNLLQKAIIEEFLPIYGFGAEVLYVGDTSDKYLFLNEVALRKLNFEEIAHNNLPDVIAYSKTKNWLFLIEAVTTANPITEIRKLKLEEMAKNCGLPIVYLTAFPDRATFRKHVKDVAWETEVWIADTPEHLIHFNGDKFMGPYSTNPISNH